MTRHSTVGAGRRHAGLLVLPLLLCVAGSCLLGLRGEPTGAIVHEGDKSASLPEPDGSLHDADLLGTEDEGNKGLSCEEGEVEQVAARLLCAYRDRGDCVLASSGYLDLFGSVWSCVVEGDGWADVCLVVQMDEGQLCQVSVTHLDACELGQLF